MEFFLRFFFILSLLLRHILNGFKIEILIHAAKNLSFIDFFSVPTERIGLTKSTKKARPQGKQKRNTGCMFGSEFQIKIEVITIMPLAVARDHDQQPNPGSQHYGFSV